MKWVEYFDNDWSKQGTKGLFKGNSCRPWRKLRQYTFFESSKPDGWFISTCPWPLTMLEHDAISKTVITKSFGPRLYLMNVAFASFGIDFEVAAAGRRCNLWCLRCWMWKISAVRQGLRRRRLGCQAPPPTFSLNKKQWQTVEIKCTRTGRLSTSVTKGSKVWARKSWRQLSNSIAWWQLRWQQHRSVANCCKLLQNLQVLWMLKRSTSWAPNNDCCTHTSCSRGQVISTSLLGSGWGARNGTWCGIAHSERLPHPIGHTNSENWSDPCQHHEEGRCGFQSTSASSNQ